MALLQSCCMSASELCSTLKTSLPSTSLLFMDPRH